MKASYKWLKEFVDFTLSPEELSHTLTMAGLEVEAVEAVGDDTVFDIGVTPNRPDWLSIRGIARELSALLGTEFRDVSPVIEGEEGKGPVVRIDNPELCPRYSSRIISGVKPGPSPEWLSRRLESCGIRPTSNIVDVTNLVLLELGQPMHAFDLDRLAGQQIVVKQAGDVSLFTTLDDEERKLSQDMLLIWDAEKPVAIAGVMGGRNTEVSESTVNVLLESACFNPSSVRKTSKALNLSTESAYRFERGVDIESAGVALDRAAQLISDIAGGQITAVTDEYPVPFKERKIYCSIHKISSVIGVDFEASFIEDLLAKLGFKTERRSRGEGIDIVPPSFRNDVEGDIDIIEEVARLFGYDNIPSTLPVIQMNAVPEHKMHELAGKLKDSMVASGYSEVINFSFMNPAVLDILNLSLSDRRRNLLYVKNPLRKEDSAMRTSLVPALLHNVGLNLNRGENMLRFFEIASVFLHAGRKLPDEVMQMSVAFHKGPVSSVWQSKHEGFYDLKGALENIFGVLGIKNISFVKDPAGTEPYLHPGKSSSIMIGDEIIGCVGVLHPGVAESFDIKGDITIAELYDLAGIRAAIPSEKTFHVLPRYPYIERDIALVVSEDITVAAVRKEIMSVETDIIEAVHLFDIYKGKPIPQDKKSLAFSIRYRSADRTLTDREVDEIHAEIVRRLQSNLNAELRA